MIDPAWFIDACLEQQILLYTGVPDSLLRHLCASMIRKLPRGQHVIAANEGAATGIAVGHYLRTGTPALVYMQNSGFGNVINPLVSLADPEVYAIPMLLIVGWRGRVGARDEPQHVKQGRVMEMMLDALEIPWAVLPADQARAGRCLRDSVAATVERACPYVLMVEPGTFCEVADADLEPAVAGLASREEALNALVRAVGNDAAIVSSTGMLSRELFDYRERSGTDGRRDLLTVGGMGHASSIALGMAMREPNEEVWCFDGDGALLMHLGSIAVIADHAPTTFFHAVFNNGVHDSVGGQPTSIRMVDIPAAAQALGYRFATSTADLGTLIETVAQLRAHGGPSLLELRVRPGSRPGIGRPTRAPLESKQRFLSAFGGSG